MDEILLIKLSLGTGTRDASKSLRELLATKSSWLPSRSYATLDYLISPTHGLIKTMKARVKPYLHNRPQVYFYQDGNNGKVDLLAEKNSKLSTTEPKKSANIKNIAVVGSSGAIGKALLQQMSNSYQGSTLQAFSQSKPREVLPNVIYHTINYSDEDSIAAAATIAAKKGPFDLVVIAVGILHDGDIKPEKSLRELSHEKFQHLFTANAIVPALIIKHFAPKLRKDYPAILAALSARVGSISDNRLGGWYAYRAAKAALNMIIKNTSIEIARTHKQAVVVGLHPGTVDSGLSKPFQGNVPKGKLFTPEFSAQSLIKVLDEVTTEDSGKCFAWDGQEIKP